MMPLYDFRCEKGHVFERMVKLADFKATQHCACTLPASRVISAPMISVDSTGYDCPITGKWIGSKREHQENLARHDCRVLEAGETEQNMAMKAEKEAAFEKSLDDTVEKTIDAMSSDKKEKLTNELLSGVDLAVERTS